MKINSALAVESSTASIILNKNLRCGNCLEVIKQELSQNSQKAILCYEKGWYELGKSIKDLFGGQNLACFCLDEEIPFLQSAPKLLNSVNNLQELIVIGDEQLALFALDYCLKSSARVTYIPLDFEFSSFLLRALENNNNLLIIDENLLSACGKNKVADGIRCVLSKKIFFVEMLVNQSIAGLFDCKRAENCLNEGLKELKSYLATRSLEKLILALLYVTASEYLSGCGNIASSASIILLKMQNLSLKGEREYLLYKMILRSYELYFTNDTSFTLSLPGVVVEENEINALFANEYIKKQIALPDYLYDIKRIEEYKSKITANKELLKVIKQQLEQIEEDSAMLKRQYGGRKYSVEHYNAKQRSKALYLAPYITEKPTAFHLLFASGFTQYLK